MVAAREKGVDGKVLIGKYYHIIDAKGRVIIPAKFRDDLGSSFVVSKGIDSCLCLYSPDEWQVFESELLSKKGEKARNLQRFLLSDSDECERDDQGRALISKELREAVGLSREVVIIGVSNHAEIWDRVKWDAYRSGPKLTHEELLQAMEDLGM